MENWLPVVGYEGVYEVSDIGRVKRVGGWSDGRKTKPIGILSLGNSKKYTRIILNHKALYKKKHHHVHRLVMAAFVGPIPFGHEVNHKNGIKTDNRLENLEYVTHSVNVGHRFDVLKNQAPCGSKHYRAKVSEAEVFAMRALRKRGWQIKRIATEFKIGQSQVSCIVNRKAWTHV